MNIRNLNVIYLYKSACTTNDISIQNIFLYIKFYPKYILIIFSGDKFIFIFKLTNFLKFLTNVISKGKRIFAYKYVHPVVALQSPQLT